MSIIILPYNHKRKESILLKLRDVSRAPGKPPGAPTQQEQEECLTDEDWELKAASNVPTTFRWAAHAWQPARPPQGFSFITIQLCDSETFQFHGIFWKSESEEREGPCAHNHTRKHRLLKSSGFTVFPRAWKMDPRLKTIHTIEAWKSHAQEIV